MRFNDEAEQHLLTAVLRPGNAPASLGAIALLRRLIKRLNKAFPTTPLLIRLDAGFATPEVLDYLDAQAQGMYRTAPAALFEPICNRS